MSKYADEFWREIVMKAMRDGVDYTHPQERTDVIEAVLKSGLTLPSLVVGEYVDRAIRQLKASGELVYYRECESFTGGRGWQVPGVNFHHERQRRRDERLAKERFERRLAEARGQTTRPTVAKLLAMADSTDQPREAEAFRAKAAELQRRG